ncbi:SDS23 [Gaeumannomyces tritici R3-111a-1]|uniref:Protein SDS23 n=1 Tax=Gaeumannomyces tritici (strain R3-111a-1) TaxID=644352 RepID=J3NV75_GAET3|nr:SDS23 [Gaeumannomyces tritici R3-111a-1]EJT75251.1 SDS23 [Gaeumannomyces tritici R3-111a-1]
MDKSDDSSATAPPLTSMASNSSGAVDLQRPSSRQSIGSGAHKPSQVQPPHVAAHRQSFVENLRNPPPSPRSHRHLSFTQSALQELLSHPPSSQAPNPQFAGRDWRDVAVGELVSQDEVKWVDMDTSVEEATMVLLKSAPSNVVLVKETATDKTAISTFDFNDLNAYLLVVVGLAQPEEDQVALYHEIATKARERVAIPLRDIQPICRKEMLVTFDGEEPLSRGIEVLGSGIHRILVTSSNSDLVGILSQLKVLEFFWNEAVSFPVIDRLYPAPLRELSLGTHQIIAINADRPLADALTLMNNEGLTSVAVVDNGLNVVGNISTADVRHLTSAASMPLLESTCMNFISVILSERGVEKGRDSFPVFYVNPYSTLAHTVAKLTATQSHRMWVVEGASPSPSVPGTPLLQPVSSSSSGAAAVAAPPAGTATSMAGGSPATATSTAPGSTVLVSAPVSGNPTPQTPVQSVPAAALPGSHLSGRLTGVVSLTDILNMFAKSSGLNPSDPSEQRSRRRRSSSVSVRPSLESSRASQDYIRR